MGDDIVSDIIQRVRSLLGPDVLSNDAALTIESEVRQYWGGDRPYIGKTRCDVDIRNLRDKQIWGEHNNGERVQTLANKYHLSQRRIRQIVAEQENIRLKKRGLKSLP